MEITPLSRRGTDSSNPSPSRGESAANPISPGPGHRLDARAHEARGLTAPDGPQRGQRSIVEAANGDEAVTIDDLMQQIQETERLIDVYRNANEVICR
jgi:hypothetical protein